ncbi:MarR family transcriptional regulator [Variovorax dokdonensis]|uniref:MarR family transcriptional regulator n=1 Tax=Variovorax dokdonensis TaxID=344883 RepID=A0ABT7NCG5_9BURK|nr:MarR family transcriptional regulator [Variovorax dokdonensis]MDM0045627.1 MarR family transcriptional regulator [Variovorax dokdonensis]
MPSKPAASRTSKARVDLGAQPGHRIRRLQQIAVAVFMQETESAAVTPVQFAVLNTLAEQPGIDQRTLARLVSFDTSTIGGVIDRLEARGALTRNLSPDDRRVRLLHLTDDGRELLAAVTPTMTLAQERILEPLSASEKNQFMALMQRVIAHHEDAQRGE